MDWFCIDGFCFAETWDRGEVAPVRSLIRGIFLALIALPALLVDVRAELPPTVYRDLQQKAPEVLRIRTDEVISKQAAISDDRNWSETVHATVIEVVRTSSGVKVGDKITVSYPRMVPAEGQVGPSPPPQLKTGAEYTAFLAKSDDGKFSLSARGMSFSPLK